MKKGVHRKKEKIAKVRYSYFFSIWSTKKHMERSKKKNWRNKKKRMYDNIINNIYRFYKGVIHIMVIFPTVL